MTLALPTRWMTGSSPGSVLGLALMALMVSADITSTTTSTSGQAGTEKPATAGAAGDPGTGGGIDEAWSLGPTYGFGKQRTHVKSNPGSNTVSDLRERAENGDPNAQYFLGLLMWYGDGVATNREAALALFRKAAEQGHTHAQFNVGLVLAFSGPTGHGSDKEVATAFKWVSNAASEGLADAQWLLGLMYRDGIGTDGNKKDYDLALKAFTDSAEQGSARGHFYVGLMNEYGLGTPQDFKAAAKSYRRSASKQDPRAIYYLALMHAYGRGMDQDFQQAMILFKEAAEMGQVGAQLMLGTFYLHGQGVAGNYDLAYHWFEIAASSEDPRAAEAIKARDELGELLKNARENVETTMRKYKLNL